PGVAAACRRARGGTPHAALAGLAGAAFALGIGELVAGADARLASPVEAVAGEVIDRAPRPLERFAIETFGANDKLVLVAGTLVLSALLGALLGVVARRRPRLGAAGMAGFALLGAGASLGPPNAGPAAAVPSLAAGAAGVLVLWLLAQRIPAAGASLPAAPAPGAAAVPVAPAPAGQPPRARRGLRPVPGAAPAVPVAAAPEAPVPVTSGGRGSRRAFFGLAAGVAAAAALAAAGGRALRDRFGAAESRAGVVLPRPARPLPAIPAAAGAGVPGVTPFVTPNAEFYRIDTALTVPQVRAEDWTLSVTGMVDEPFELTFDELLDRGLIEADITMTCVSNPVGGDLVGNARWLGVPTRDLLDAARPTRAADQLVGRSVDGYTCGFPLAAAYDRPSLVAVGMNGVPLPLRHGFPARLVTPGIYGYAGSTKWLTELEVTTFDALDQYWVPRGYATRAPIKTMARIDTPRSLERVSPGPVAVGGVAWAQTRGITAVEVRVDDEPFRPAELAAAVSDDAWRQWRFDWDATPGRHTLTVRAVDGTGETQTGERAETLPDGASGWMSLVVTVDGRAG
ncbi:MAG TPA: molybdopterin-dependent oxidoreductase, partial [Acidimicrobiales bacterium]|nr:molybdopterin-dependent oxidoreductase [Acidimicrobiales bacterium]